MDEKEGMEKSNLSSGFSSGIIWAIVFAIIVLLLGVFTLIDFGLMGVGNLILACLAGAGFGFLLGFIYGVFPKKMKFLAVLIILLILILVFFVFLPLISDAPFYTVFSSAGSRLGFIGDAFSEIANYRFCLVADIKCPFFVDWESPNINEPGEEELKVNLKFSEKQITQENQLNLLVSLTVTNPESSDLVVVPRCYNEAAGQDFNIDKMGAYSLGDKFIFPTSNKELHTSFRCKGDIERAYDKNLYSEQVIISLERPVNVKTIWPVMIGETPHIGLRESEMKFDAPYTIAMTSNNDMPFIEGEEYDFQIVMKRKDSDSRLKEMSQMVIDYSEEISVNCNNFEGLDHELEIREYDHEALKQIAQYTEQRDRFSFPCVLYVSSAPTEAVLSPINLQADLVVYTEYKVRVIKTPQ